jgi:hypothetical protein
MYKQLSLLPLMCQFDKEGFITETTYWETDVCEEGKYYLVFNMNTYSLLIPEYKDDWLVEITEAQSVVITKGNYNGKNDCFEIMFEDNTETPYMIIIPDEQFSRITPLKDGWNGNFYIYVGSLFNCKIDFENVYYRVANILPYCNPAIKN